MKLKGINPIEQHVEKFVLVIFALALLGFLVMQFLGEPNAVEVSGRTVPPENARELVRDKALQVKGQLESVDPAPALEGELTNYVEPFARRLETQDVPAIAVESLGASALARADSPGMGTGGIGDIGSTADPLHVPTPPSPSEPLVAPFAGAVHPLVAYPIRDEIPQLGEQPYDLRGVSVQTTFDAPSFRADINDPPEGRSQLPLDWSRNIQILDVRLFRQRMVEGAWTDEQLVPPMPGRGSIRDFVMRSNIRPAELPDLLQAERENRSEIRNPSIYRMIAGLPWVSPERFPDVKRTLPDQQQVNRILRTLESVDSELERLRTRFEGLSDKESRQAQRLTREIERAASEREDLVETLRALGVDETGERIDFVSEESSAYVPAVGQNLLDEPDPVTILAHDVTLRTGATYRYRVRLVLMNPLFGRQTRLLPEQKDMAEALTMTIDSTWSDAIEVPEPVKYFVLDATPRQRRDGLAQPASIRALAARFHYGYWRTAEARVRVGSTINVTASMPALWTWSIEETDEGPAVTGRTDLDQSLSIRTMSLLLGVDPAVDRTVSALDSLVYLHEEGPAPRMRTPSEDRGRRLLAEIRYSSQQGEGASLPESLSPGEEGE